MELAPWTPVHYDELIGAFRPTDTTPCWMVVKGQYAYTIGSEAHCRAYLRWHAPEGASVIKA